MRFIFGLFALAGAAILVLVFYQPGSGPKLALPHQGAAQAPAAKPAPEQKAVPAPKETPVAAAPAKQPVQEPAAAPVPAPARKPQPPAAAMAAPDQPAPARPASGPTPAASASGPTITIRPPNGLEGIAFGMSADQVTSRYPIAWRKETADSLTLVHYPQGQGDQVQFTFGHQGLSRLELLLKPPQGQSVNQYYQAVRENYTSIYGSLPGTASNGWTDGRTVLRISPAPTGVSVAFYPKE
jgi:hypothetical protein